MYPFPSITYTISGKGYILLGGIYWEESALFTRFFFISYFPLTYHTLTDHPSGIALSPVVVSEPL